MQPVLFWYQELDLWHPTLQAGALRPLLISTEWVNLSAVKIFYFLAMDIDNTLYNNGKKITINLQLGLYQKAQS